MDRWHHPPPSHRIHVGEPHDRSFSRTEPQHLQYCNDNSFGHGKRQRDSPVSSEGEWQTSFKRLKVMDDGSSTTDSLYSTITNYSSFESRFDAVTSQQFNDDEQHPTVAYLSSNASLPQSLLYHPPPPHHHHHQSAGEQPFEPSCSYQPMNSLLGNLHSLRQQRAGGAQPAAQPPAPVLEPAVERQVVHSIVPHKKQVTLRTSSKLY